MDWCSLSLLLWLVVSWWVSFEECQYVILCGHECKLEEFQCRCCQTLVSTGECACRDFLRPSNIISPQLECSLLWQFSPIGDPRTSVCVADVVAKIRPLPSQWLTSLEWLIHVPWIMTSTCQVAMSIFDSLLAWVRVAEWVGVSQHRRCFSFNTKRWLLCSIYFFRYM